MGASRGPKHQSTCQHLLGQQALIAGATDQAKVNL